MIHLETGHHYIGAGHRPFIVSLSAVKSWLEGHGLSNVQVFDRADIAGGVPFAVPSDDWNTLATGDHQGPPVDIDPPATPAWIFGAPIAAPSSPQTKPATPPAPSPALPAVAPPTRSTGLGGALAIMLATLVGGSAVAYLVARSRKKTR